MSQLKMQSTWEKPAPGVTQASTHMHGAQTSVHMGLPGSQTANFADAGSFKTHQHTMPDVHFTKPQHDSQFVGTHEHAGETSIHKGHGGSQTGAGPDAGAWPA